MVGIAKEGTPTDHVVPKHDLKRHDFACSGLLIGRMLIIDKHDHRQLIL